MAIFAIADLHLSQGTDKPMHIFGSQWLDHQNRLEQAWLASVGENDTVIIPGDISWGMTLEEALPDLQFIHQLPGRKILSKGNHDYWWGTLGKVEAMSAQMGLTSLSFMKNNAFLVEGRAVCGTRGWLLPSDPEFKTSDKVIYEREVGRLERSLIEGRALLLDAGEKSSGVGRDITGEDITGEDIIAVIHYPPLLLSVQNSDFCALLEKFRVKTCIYGHLHGKGHSKAFEGVKNGVNYHLVAGDYISFKPLRL
jgi:predicted phosphohydrolase